MAAPFWRIRCGDCSNEQVVFSRPATEVTCVACGGVLASPRSGEARPKGEILATLE